MSDAFAAVRFQPPPRHNGCTCLLCQITITWTTVEKVGEDLYRVMIGRVPVSFYATGDQLDELAAALANRPQGDAL